MPDIPKPAPVIDTTIEDALKSVAYAIRRPVFATDARLLIAEGAELEFKIVVRQHHDGKGFCVSLDKFIRTAPQQIMWRKRLQ